MAAVPAWHALREMAGGLGIEGTKAACAIHPVAGKMSGHMHPRPARAATPPRRANVK